MAGITKNTLEFLNFVFDEYKKTENSATSPASFTEDIESDDFLMDNLQERLQSDSHYAVLFDTDIAFLQHIFDVHENNMQAGNGSLWKGSLEEERSLMDVCLAEFRTAQKSQEGRWMKYTGFSGTYDVIPKLSMYNANNNLYVGLNCYDVEFGGMDSFTDITVNLGALPYLFAAIDTNNNGHEVLDFLQKEGFGEPTGYTLSSGFCSYPVFCFNEDKVKELDPDLFSAYAKLHDMDKVMAKASLDTQISGAKAKTVSNKREEGIKKESLER